MPQSPASETIGAAPTRSGSTIPHMPRKPQLLIIEDEEPIRVGLEDLFVYHGFAVDSAADGPADWPRRSPDASI
jgi:hypothetical protein